MSDSLPGSRPLPESRYDLTTYWGRVRHSANIADMRTLLASAQSLNSAKDLLIRYKTGKIKEMNDDLWQAKKLVDSTIHPDTGKPILLPFRMSCFVLSNLIVTAGMLTPGLGTTGTLFWQITNQSLNVAINTSNANKSHPLSTGQLATSYALAVSASCSVAVGLNSLVPRLTSLSAGLRTTLGRLVPFAAVATAGVLNVFLMRSQEIRSGIDVSPVAPQLSSTSSPSTRPSDSEDAKVLPIGTSRRAALIAVSETALSRVINATPIMVLPPLVLLRLQRQRWLATNPRLVLPVNLGLILATSLVALPCALGVFPARQRVPSRWLEDEFHDVEWLEFNRGL